MTRASFPVPPPPRVVACGEVPWQPWRNGHGRTRELLAWPSADGWCVRVSVAEIASAAPFSAFEGVERWFTVIDGDGVELRLPGVSMRLGPRSAPVRFDGASAVGASPIGGPTLDLNLMVRGGPGRMAAAEPEAWWAPADAFARNGSLSSDGQQPHAGFFSAVPARWVAELASRRTVVSIEGQLPANALVWFDQAPKRLRASPVPAVGAPTPPAPVVGWWLAGLPAGGDAAHDGDGADPKTTGAKPTP